MKKHLSRISLLLELAKKNITKQYKTNMSTLRSNLGAILTEVSSFQINHEDLKLKLNCLQDKKKSLIENIDNLMEAAQTNFQETPDELKHILDQGDFKFASH